MNTPEGFPTPEELNAAALERDLYPNETPEVTARRIFREGLASAAAGIVKIALNSTNDRTKLTACQYIVDRNLGKIGDDPTFSDKLSGIVEDIEAALQADADRR
jgi:hypothetical protein